jgi:hypothetical protein
MAKRAKFEERFEVSREKLFAFLTDPEARKAEALEIGGALEAEAEATKPSDGRIKMVLSQKVYGRGMDGKKDKSKTERATYTEEWDTETFESSWNYRLEQTFGDRVKVEGRKKLVARGDHACTYMDEVSVDVNVPMIGGMIAGKVISSMERAQPRLMEWMKNKLNER